MPKKWIRKDKNGRVEEVVVIADIKKFNKSYHADHIKLGEVIEKACKVGQVYDTDSGKYVNYKESTEKANERKKDKARSNIALLRREAIDKLIETSDNPEVMAIVAKMKIEEGKL